MNAGESGWTLFLPIINLDASPANATSAVLHVTNPDNTIATPYAATIGTLAITVNGVAYAPYSYAQVLVTPTSGYFTQAGSYQVELWITLANGLGIRKANVATVKIGPSLT